MSSGNPFRASLALHQAPPSPVPPTASGIPTSTPEARNPHGDELQHAASPPSRTRKHVRIESSTVSIPLHPDAQYVHDSVSERATKAQSRPLYADSPSYATSVGFSNANINDDGLYTREPGRGLDMPAQSTLGSSGRAPDTHMAALSPSNAPANPFSKTLASIEPSERGSGDDRTPTERPALGRNRASLDVESFKNLLMTGRPSLRQPGQPSQAPAASSLANAPIFESSSSTDTSSISRQSLFEPAHEPPSDSPRTSYEMAASEDNDRAVQVPEQRKEKKKPPPAPKHRHGKLVSSRQPQTVSFDSFAATDHVAPPPPPKSRDSSDMHKPLPPTPVMSPPHLHLDTQDITPEGTSTASQRISEPPSATEALQSQKRIPPPVPLGRRQSQLRTSTASSRSRSSSSLTLGSQQSLDGPLPSPSQSINDPMSGIKSPPPPPPPRHGARLSNIGSSSASSSTTELPQRSASVRTTESIRGPSSSRRSTLDSESSPVVADVDRMNSTSSKRNSPRAISGESTGSAMPPPPPPPRRRQSNRSSLEIQRPYNPSSSPNESRRTSTEYRRTSTEHRNFSPENRRPSTDSKRRTSVASESSLRHEYAPTDERAGNEFPLYSPNEEAENMLGANMDTAESRSDSTNILDDMEKFQREIDELRTRFKQAG